MGLKRKTPLKRTPIKKTPWDKAKKDQEKKKAKAGLSKSKLRDKLDAVFSKYIRLKYSDDKGYCRCISCGKVFPWKEIQNGHYMSRRYMSTRFSEDNCRHNAWLAIFSIKAIFRCIAVRLSSRLANRGLT